MNGSRKKPPDEQKAVVTTIVGGRPPGSGKVVGVIPHGLEVLVKKAAVDPEFRKQLLAERARAADLIGLRIEQAEAFMLDMVPREQLEQIIDKTIIRPEHRSALLGKVAAAMMGALGLGSATCDC